MEELCRNNLVIILGKVLPYIHIGMDSFTKLFTTSCEKWLVVQTELGASPALLRTVASLHGGGLYLGVLSSSHPSLLCAVFAAGPVCRPHAAVRARSGQYDQHPPHPSAGAQPLPDHRDLRRHLIREGNTATLSQLRHLSSRGLQ